jgi:hypothetical protein
MPRPPCPDRSATRNCASFAPPLPARLTATLMLLAVPSHAPPCSATQPQPLCGVKTPVPDPDDATCILRWSQVPCFIAAPDGPDTPGTASCGIRFGKSLLWEDCGRPIAITGGCP